MSLSPLLSMAFLLFLVATMSPLGSRAQQAPAPAPSGSSWKTLTGAAPIVIANGGQSGLFPDQTIQAYVDALNRTAGGTALFCDVQLSKDGQGVCRTNIDLKTTTNVDTIFPNSSNTYVVNGVPTGGYFSIDFTGEQLLNNITAKQANPSRVPYFDGVPLVSPEELAGLLASYTNDTGLPGLLWLNVQYSKFFEEHKINMTSYVLSAIKNLAPDYVSSTEVALLKTLRSKVGKTNTKLVFRIPNVTAVEPTTNQTYDSLMKNLTNIKAFASGILVPKDQIWPINSRTFFLEAPTTLVQDAHRAKLEVHAFDFFNDVYPSSFNYSFDPIKELLYFINEPNFAVDGVLTDFPTTASVAIECYANGAGPLTRITDKSVIKPFTGKQVITHSGGDSGNYPGSTRLSFMSAINKGADFIDCPVQMTKDGIPICRESPDLLITTTVASSPFVSRTRQVSSIQEALGVFTFDLTWEEISTLKANILSPQADSSTYRDQAYDGTQNILTLSDFLSISKANPNVGIYIVLENAYVLNGTLGIDTVTAIASALKKEGLDNNTNVVIQSEDAAVLRALQKLLSANLIYSISLPQNGSIALTDSVVKEIKLFASGVAVPRRFISPSSNGILTGPTDVVKVLHSHNLSVVVVYFRNEFVSLPIDFLADPTFELHTYLQYYGVDAVVTDFPGTAKSYMGNRCLRAKSLASSQAFSIPTVVPGDLQSQLPGFVPPPQGAPVPPLSIAEPPLPPSSVAPAPSPTQSSSMTMLPGVLLLHICLAVHFLSWYSHH